MHVAGTSYEYKTTNHPRQTQGNVRVSATSQLDSATPSAPAPWSAAGKQAEGSPPANIEPCEVPANIQRRPGPSKRCHRASRHGFTQPKGKNMITKAEIRESRRQCLDEIYMAKYEFAKTLRYVLPGAPAKTLEAMAALAPDVAKVIRYWTRKLRRYDRLLAKSTR